MHPAMQYIAAAEENTGFKIIIRCFSCLNIPSRKVVFGAVRLCRS